MEDTAPPGPSERFDRIYAEGRPPWDIGRPQPAVVEAEARGELAGRILDIGCGTGENSLFLAAKGHVVVGADLSRHALRQATENAGQRGLEVPFHLVDALKVEPGSLGGRFDTVLDSALFHVFDDTERARYVQALERVLCPGGTYHMFVFSDREPTDWGGPRRISEDEIHDAFRRGWEIEEIQPVRYETNLDVTGHAWHARIRRL